MGSIRSRSGLLTLAALPPVLEASVLSAVGYRGARGLAPQASAVWPYDTYHDLRWLLVFHRTVAWFVAGLIALVVLRGLLSATLVILAWPTQAPPPPRRRLILRNLWVAALTTLFVTPWTALSVAAAVTSLSWFLLASLLPMLLLSPFLLRAGVTPGWWRGWPSSELVGWSSLNFVVLTVAGSLVWSAPGWWGVPVAGLAGLANGQLWERTVRSALLPARPVLWPRVPVAPLVVALVLIGSIAAQAVIGVTAGSRGRWRPPVLRERLPPEVGHAVIVLAGHGSDYAGQKPTDPRVERFSYRGLDPAEQPLPYGPLATHQSLESSAALLARHVESLHRRSGRPIALIGQSEGAMVIRTYLERWRDTPVDAALLFSPLIRPGRIYYPPAGASTGWGVVTGWQVRALFGLANLPTGNRDNPDEPFLRSLLENAPFYRSQTLCPVPGVRMVAFIPTVSAAEAPPGQYSGIPVFQLPAFHGGLLGQPQVESRVVDVLAGESLHIPRGEYPLFQRLGAAWQAPPLPLSINPVWRGAGQPDPAFTGRVCLPT